MQSPAGKKSLLSLADDGRTVALQLGPGHMNLNPIKGDRGLRSFVTLFGTTQQHHKQ